MTPSIHPRVACGQSCWTPFPWFVGAVRRRSGSPCCSLGKRRRACRAEGVRAASGRHTVGGELVLGGSSSPSLRRRGGGLGGCSGQVMCLLSCETSTELSGGWEEVGEERVGRLADMRAERKRVSPGPCVSLSVAGLWDQGQGDSPLPRMTLRPGSVSTGALGGCRGTQHHPWAEGESGEWCRVDASENYPEGKLRMSLSSGRACGLSYKSQVNYRVSE